MAALVCNAADTNAPNSAVETLTSQITTQSNVHFLSSEVPIAFLDPGVKAPFKAIQQLFDHLQSNPDDATALNATYPRRGIHKTAATSNPTSDPKNSPSTCPPTAANRFHPSSPPRSPSTACKTSSPSSTP
jgi:hypothetical protein